jgi:predicted negative regulator of RcsB-dependent stress response
MATIVTMGVVIIGGVQATLYQAHKVETKAQMDALASKADVERAKGELASSLEAAKGELASSLEAAKGEFASSLEAAKGEFASSLEAAKGDLKTAMAEQEARIIKAISTQR